MNKLVSILLLFPAPASPALAQTPRAWLAGTHPAKGAESKPLLLIVLHPDLAVPNDSDQKIDIVAGATVQVITATAPGEAEDKADFLLHVVPGMASTNAKESPKGNEMVSFSSVEDIEILKKEGLWGKVTATVRYTFTLRPPDKSAPPVVIRGESSGIASQLKKDPGRIGGGVRYIIAGRLADLTKVARAQAVANLKQALMEELGKHFIKSALAPSAYYARGFRMTSIVWDAEPKVAELTVRNELPFQIRGKLLARLTWATPSGTHGTSINNAPVVAGFDLTPGQDDVIRFRIPEGVIRDANKRDVRVPESLKGLSRVQITELSIIP